MSDDQAAAEWEKLRKWLMPFGRFKGRHLYEIPAEYLCWFEQRGWPEGDLADCSRSFSRPNGKEQTTPSTL